MPNKKINALDARTAVSTDLMLVGDPATGTAYKSTLGNLPLVPTSRTITINGVAFDLSANRAWTIGTVTSVGLTMPSAFNVGSSPITSSGTIAVTALGTASQYIRGDGVLATLPTGGSGGSSVSYYLNGGTAASVGTYFQMSTNAVVGANADFTRTGNGLISQFLTDVGDPNRLQIPAGNWNFEMFFSMSSSGGTPQFYVELLKYDGTTFTSIASSSAIPEVISGGTIIDLYLTSLAIPATTLLATDRLALRVYIVNNSGGRTATLHTQDSHLCQIITNFAGGVSALNGLTANTQYFATGTSGTDFGISSASDTHTFNLPTASATNRGALSSADWTTFNNKVPTSRTLTINGTTQDLTADRTFTIATANIYTDNGTLTGARTLTHGGFSLSLVGSTHTNRFTSAGRLLLGTTSESTNVLDVNGTARVTGQTTITGSTTAATSIARGVNLTPTLVAAANDDVLVGLDVNPTFTNGAFTNVRNYAIRSSADIAFTNVSNRALSIEQSNNIVEGRSLSINGGSANSTGSGSFDSLLQTTRAWVGIVAAPNGNVYAASNNGDIYMQTNGAGNFVALGQTSRLWRCLAAAPNGNIYATDFNGDIYKQTNGTGNFVGLSQTSRGWIGIAAAPNGNIYAIDYGGDIYMQTNGIGNFIALGQTSRNWFGIACSPNGNVYASVNNGDIYMQTNGVGNFVALSQTSRNWYNLAVAPSGDVYVNVPTGDIYMQTNGVGNFVALNQINRNWWGLAAASNGNVYAGVINGDIYMQTNVAGTPNLNGGSLTLASGAGKGTGTSTISFQTGTTQISGVIIQPVSTKMTILGNGSVGIGTISPNASALLDVASTIKGFLPPRMTTTQKNAIATPAAGLMVYDTTLNKLCVYTTAWETITSL